MGRAIKMAQAKYLAPHLYSLYPEYQIDWGKMANFSELLSLSESEASRETHVSRGLDKIFQDAPGPVHHTICRPAMMLAFPQILLGDG
ncbi:MAG TPA: hypothetical protein VI386_14570 [Candidatus Sulfotelmatobacter sp.]